MKERTLWLYRPVILKKKNKKTERYIWQQIDIKSYKEVVFVQF